MWTKSACVMLAWCILSIIVIAAGATGSVRQAQANIRIASSSSTEIILASTLSVAPASVTGRRPVARYVVQPGDTLSGIAARFAVRGGWSALYAANRPLIGPDPEVIRLGTVLVLPGETAPVRYRVVSGDTLAAIAASLGVRGGWSALYAANRPLIGPDPGMIRPGTVLRIPGAAAPSPAAANPGRPSPPPSAASGVSGGGHRPAPRQTTAPAGTGMPRWLTTVLLVAGLLTGAAFLAEPVLMLRRRRAARLGVAGSGQESGPGQESVPGQEPGPGPVPGSGPVPGYARLGGRKARVVLADFDRVVVTHSASDDTVYVLRPPGEDPEAILRAARLVLHEGPYRQLAAELGLPASWPVVLADHDRLVVTRSTHDDLVYVLRPPGEDPAAILRAARLVLPEGPYGELADQLGVPSGLPME
jgi:LysM repeat protein